MIQIKLESTLYDFFAAEDSRNHTSSPAKTFVSYNPISDQDLTSTLPRNTKYIIQQWQGSSEGDDRSPIINLVLMPQRIAWLAGRMPVIFVDHEVFEEQTDPMISSRVEEDLAETIAVIDPECRFKPKLCKSLEEIRTSVGNTEAIPFLPSDGLANLRHHINPDDHYELLSKRELALSGLPTPKAQLVDFTAPKIGWDTKNLNDEIAQAISAIHHRLPPFVLKSKQVGARERISSAL